jgi:hypothetical protein
MIPLMHCGDSTPPDPPSPYRHDARLDDLQNAKKEIKWLAHDRERWRTFTFVLTFFLSVSLLILACLGGLLSGGHR